MLLEVKDLNVYYGAIHALQGISFDLEEGEIVSLIGANGAGKSTTLKTISGLLRARTGTVKLRGEDLTAMPAQNIVKLGMVHVPEGRKIFAPLTVQENLEMGAYTRKDQAEIDAQHGASVQELPAPQGTHEPARRHPLRRRTADAGDRPRADGAAQSAAAG